MSHGNGISILIRTSNSEKPLGILLSRLQTGSQDEIILVDTGSKDGTVALAEKAGARIIRNEGPFNYSRTLNLGFQTALHDCVLVLSAHCVPVRGDFLDCYRQALARLPETWAVVYGTQVFSRKQYDQFDKSLKTHKGPEVLTRFPGAGNANALYSRRAWELHRFEESLKTGEDQEWQSWAAQAGLVCAQAPEACVYYRHPGGPIYRFKKAFDEVRVGGDQSRPRSVCQLAMGVAHACRHLLWEEFVPRSWIGQVAHLLGAFVASRRISRSK
jgi:rhamnosyltransferase